MTTAPSRPTLARKVTPKSEKNRTSALEQGIRMTIDGETYEVRMGDLTPQLARELRHATGGSFNALREELSTDPDLDSIAAFVWLARRMGGDAVALDDVELDYSAILGDDFEVDVVEHPAEVDDSPEA